MKYIIGSIVGAIIGFITNWLAIKMLFRPHKEVRIAGIRLPFTPGLIPKEKDRIAESIGKTVGEHLLNKETIVESLCSEKINKDIEGYVDNKINSIKKSNKTILEVLNEVLNGESEKLSSLILNNIDDFVIKKLRDDEVKNNIKTFITSQINEAIKNKSKDIFKSDSYLQLKKYILENGKDYINSDSGKNLFKNMMTTKLEDIDTYKSLKDIIPEEAVNSLKSYVLNKKEDIAKCILNGLKTGKAAVKINESIDQLLEGIGPMISMFIKKDMIYSKIIEGSEKLLSNENNINDLAILINEIIDKLLETKIMEIKENLSNENIDSITDAISQIIVKNLTEGEVLNNIIDKIEFNLDDEEKLESIMKKLKCDELLDRKVENIINSILYNEQFINKLKVIMEDKKNSLFNKKLSDIFGNINLNTHKKISSLTVSFYNKFMENKAEDIIETFNISKIVEDKINGFDIMFTEKLILEIANKELGAITWLGALLGGIMGLLSPILASI